MTRRWAGETGFIATADGTSLAAYEAPAREAAAAARAMLAWRRPTAGVSRWEECEARGGLVFHEGKQLSLRRAGGRGGGLRSARPAAAAIPARYEEVPGPADAEQCAALPPARPAGQGRRQLHLFAGDVRLPGMLYAAIRHGPIGDAELAGYDEAAGQRVRGLRHVVKARGWIAAVADSWWAAEQALVAHEPALADRGPRRQRGDRRAARRGADQGRGEPHRHRGERRCRDRASPTSTYRYEIAPAHPRDARDRQRHRAVLRRHSWSCGWRARHPTRPARGGQAVGISPADVVLYPMPAGGSFDRRLEHDHAIEAAVIARKVGRARSSSSGRAGRRSLAGRPRAPLRVPRQRLDRAATTAAPTRAAAAGRDARRPRANSARVCSAISTAIAARSKRGGRPIRWRSKARVPPYAIPDVAVDHVPVDVGLPTGRMRGNAPRLTRVHRRKLHRRTGPPRRARAAVVPHGACWARTRALPSASSAPRGWRSGTAARGQSGRAWPAGGSAIRRAAAVARIACVATARAARGRGAGEPADRGGRHRPDRQPRHRAPADRGRAAVRHRPGDRIGD